LKVLRAQLDQYYLDLAAGKVICKKPEVAGEGAKEEGDKGGDKGGKGKGQGKKERDNKK
jgi:hypothetical protein